MKKLFIPLTITGLFIFGCSSTPENKEKSSKEKEDGVEEMMNQLPNDTAAAKEFEEEYNKATQEVAEDTELEKDTKTN